MTNQTANRDLTDMYFLFDSTCLLFQIHDHLTKVHDLAREQAFVTSPVEVFEQNWTLT